MSKLTEGNGAIRIGALARQAGCTVPTVRYYEQVGLIPPAARRSTGHRVYDPAAAPRLAFIRRCRSLGFTIEQIRALVSLSDRADRDCTEARDIAQSHLDSVRAKMIELMTLERSLSRFVHACETTCAGGPARKCTIFKDLGLPVQQAGCCGSET